MIIGIIPARYGSTRFPGKVLADIHGKPLIQWVYEQAQKSKKLDRVIIATDDDKVYSKVKNFGGEVVMTSSSHESGTDRCAEVAKELNLEESDIVLNIQGDEPLISPNQIDDLASLLDKEDIQLGTLVKKGGKEDDILSENLVKVVLRKDGSAIYFSRSPLPHIRGKEKESWGKLTQFWTHVGLYGYKVKCLMKITNLEVGELESLEKLEQLRWIENGFTIFTKETKEKNIGVDTPEDLKRILDLLENKKALD